MDGITPCLWFDGEAGEAVERYTSAFPASNVSETLYYDEASARASGRPEGSVLTIAFELGGRPFMALNGGPAFSFTPAVSLFVPCQTRDEVDRLHELLSPGGSTLMPLDAYPFSERYAWIEDRYGVSWQLFTGGSHDDPIAPALLFVGEQCGEAEAAIRFYTSLIPDSAIGAVTRYGPDQPREQEGTVMHASFELAGQPFKAMDSAQDHDFTFSEATSFVLHCQTQEEIDRFWTALTEGGQPGQCGWLKDRYSVSWQVVPTVLPELLGSRDRDGAGRAMEAMLDMAKLDIATLEDAYEGRGDR